MKNKAIAFIKAHPQLIILVVMFLVFCMVIPQFGTERNILNFLKTASITAFTCIGLSVVVIGGNLDLSVGSTMSCLCVFSVAMQRISPALGILVPLAAAVGIGLLNGILVYKFKMNSIVVTLGTMSVLSGLALVPTNAASVQGVSGTWYSAIAGTMLGAIPIYILYFAVLAVAVQLFLSKTTFGKSLYYLGINPKAAEAAGQDVGKTTVLSFVICSLCVCCAAIIQSSRMLTANPIGGQGLEFEALTAVLIGGISLRGGRGNILSTVTGVLMLTIIVNGMNLLGLAFEYQMMARGVLVLLAIVADAVVNWRAER